MTNLHDIDDTIDKLSLLYKKLVEESKYLKIVEDTLKLITSISYENEQLKSLLAKCSKCNGAGWVWNYELDTYDTKENEYNDDTKYTCDECKGIGYRSE